MPANDFFPIFNRKVYVNSLIFASVYFCVHLFTLNIPSEMFFDEVYYIPAAQDYLSFKSDSNWVHPPLGKMLIAIGAFLFPWLGIIKWRIASAFFGSIIIALSYLFSTALFNEKRAGFIAGFLTFCDCLLFAQSRIASLDIFIAFFMLLSSFWLYFYIFYDFANKKKERLFICLSSLCASFASSCKWSGIFALFFIIFSVIFLKKRTQETVSADDQRLSLYLDIFLVFSVFFASYLIPLVYFFATGGSLLELVDIYAKILDFQRGEGWEHNYLSPIWQWVLMIRPIWYYFKDLESCYSGIIAMGNPFIWWSFLVFLIFLIRDCLVLKDKKDFFLLCGYFFSYVFWFFAPRNGFFYYMLPAVPWMVFIIVRGLSGLLNYRHGGFICVLYLAATLISFGVYYPLLSGISVSKSFFRTVMLLKTWI